MKRFWRRSRPSLHKEGNFSSNFCGGHLGKKGWNSGRLVTPGQLFSVGVPSNLGVWEVIFGVGMRRRKGYKKI